MRRRAVWRMRLMLLMRIEDHLAQRRINQSIELGDMARHGGGMSLFMMTIVGLLHGLKTENRGGVTQASPSSVLFAFERNRE